MIDDLGVTWFVYKLHVRQQMIKPGNGGYNIGGDCEKGSGSVANCLGLCLSGISGAYPVAGIQARVREIWQISRGIVRDFLRRGGKGKGPETGCISKINNLG